jgi:hypothetical protein
MAQAGDRTTIRASTEEEPMATLTQTLHHEHEELLDGIEHIRLAARELPVLSPVERDLVRGRVVDFLRDTLVPHSLVEESELYPAVARLLGHADATKPMIYDHLAIRERLADLVDADAGDLPRLQELLYGIYALIKVHLWKEEELYLPLVDVD